MSTPISQILQKNQKTNTLLNQPIDIPEIKINDDDERLSTFTVEQVGDKRIISLLSGKITTCWTMSEKILNTLK
jgi:hypothetical protein